MPISDQALFEKGLPIRRKTRSLLNLAMLTALNRPAELKLHMKAVVIRNQFMSISQELDPLVVDDWRGGRGTQAKW